MKVYTEEQVRDMLKSTHIHTDNDVDMILPQFTPIELPSDEEIYKEAYKKREMVFSFISGAKFVINKIQGGNK